MVGIDGQGGAGKSTLSRELARQLGARAALVEGDDFYRDTPEHERTVFDPQEGYDRYFDWQRLRVEVLLPVRHRASRLCYQRYDWAETRMGGWVESPMPAVVIVDGVYILRPQLRDLVDVKAYVVTSERTRHRRQVERNENSARWIRRWAAAEDYYVATNIRRGLPRSTCLERTNPSQAAPRRSRPPLSRPAGRVAAARWTSVSFSFGRSEPHSAR